MVREQVSSPSPSFTVLNSPGSQLPRFPASAPVLGGGGRPEKEQGTRVAGAGSGMVTRSGGSTRACGAAEWSMRGGPGQTSEQCSRDRQRKRLRKSNGESTKIETQNLERICL